MSNLVFFLEEQSAKEMLKGIMPRIIQEDKSISVHYVVFQGKQDLEKNLVRKLRGWLLPDSVFVVMRDQDSGDCKEIKVNLAAKLSSCAGERKVLIRIACRELESFYLGDLAAVEKGLELEGIKGQQQREKFRCPDALGSPSDELFKLTRNAYDKVSGSRAISPHLNLEKNCSPSFMALVAGIKKLAGC